jgi:hypothetical protein
VQHPFLAGEPSFAAGPRLELRLVGRKEFGVGGDDRALPGNPRINPLTVSL